MTCSFPPELDEIQLMAYLEDEAGDEVRTHLAKCPHCRTRAEALDRNQAWLASGLFRATCPSAAELGDYYFERLPEAERQLVSRHLPDCPHCTRELDQLRDYLQSLSPELQPSLLAEVRLVLGRLLGGEFSDDRITGAAPALAGVRGDGDGSRVYQADDVQVAIQISDEREQPGRKTMLGLLSSDALEGAPVYLWDSGGLIAESAVSDARHFTFTGLVPGEYTLIISSPGAEIHLVIPIQ